MPPRRKPGRPAHTHREAPLSPVDITRAAAMKRFREQNQMNQAELGSMLGVSQATISAYEQARTRIPDDVFEQLVASAREIVETQVAPDVETAQQRAMDDQMSAEGDIPPEVLAALKQVADAQAGDPDAAAALGETMRTMRDQVANNLPALQKEAVPSVRMAYQLLAKILGRLDPDLGGIVDAQSGELAVSLVQAAEVSPLLARLVEMLKVGPMSNFIVLHLMIVVQYDGVRQERSREKQRLAQLAQPAPTPEPLHPSAAQVIDPSMGAFGAAAA